MWDPWRKLGLEGIGRRKPRDQIRRKVESANALPSF